MLLLKLSGFWANLYVSHTNAGNASVSSKDRSGNSDSPKSPLQTGRYNVLDTDGFKTSGLTGSTSIQLKGVDNYRIKVQPGLEPKLEKDRERAAEIRHLIDGLHPGCQAPEDISFRGVSLAGKDLERIRFTENNLKNCDFRQSKLRGSHWKNCDLSGVDFRKADLTDCIIDGCNLNGADLRYTSLANARIIDCDLFAANFDNSILDNAVIDHCEMGAQSFHNSSCEKLKLFSCHIIHGFFDNANLTGATLNNVLFRSCTLTNTRFEKTQMTDCVFKGCDSFHDGPIFSGSTLTKVVMMDCEFHAARLVDTKITKGHWERINMDSALLDGTQFSDVKFHEGVFKNCYTLETAPVFNQCLLDHLVIDQAELASASFNKSSFIGATIRDSDFSCWQLKHTGLDPETVIESTD